MKKNLLFFRLNVIIVEQTLLSNGSNGSSIGASMIKSLRNNLDFFVLFQIMKENGDLF